jgi:hypothetical protein
MSNALLQQVLDVLQMIDESGKINGAASHYLEQVMEAITNALEQPEQLATVYIQRDHLLNAMQAPFLCRVEPTQRLPDFVPMCPVPRSGADAETLEMFSNIHSHQELFSVSAVNKAFDAIKKRQIMKIEYCCRCCEATCRPGVAGDSLYTETGGPFCKGCFLLYAAPAAPSTLTQSTHAADVLKKDVEIDRLRKELADMAAQLEASESSLVALLNRAKEVARQRDRYRKFYVEERTKANADRLDAQRYRWLCDNNFDKVGVTQIHTLIKTWEPHSQTGEPQLWSQRTRGGKLDAAIDAAINNNQNQEMQLEIAKRAATMSDINSMTRFDSSMTREQIIEKMNQLTNTKPVVIIKNS